MTKLPGWLLHLAESAFLAALACAIAPSICFGQWKSLGPFGGGVQVVANFGLEQGELIAGTRNALLFRSIDRAESWQPLAFPRSLLSTLNALTVDHCNPETIYIGISDSKDSTGLYKTTDGGKSWTPVAGLLGESVTALADAPTVCGTVAAGTLSGVLISADGGNTWDRISPADHPGLRPVVSIAFEPGSSDVLYAGTPHLPWKTSDRGNTWDSIHVGIIDDSDIFSIAASQTRVLIGACSGIYRSGNAGIQWQKVLGIPGDSRRTYVVRPDPRNDRIIYAGTSMGLWKSTDGGLMWTRKSALPIRAITIDPEDSRNLFLASDDGILKSQDGGDTLMPSNLGFSNRKLEAFEDMGTTLMASAPYDVGSGTVFVSGDDGHAWTSPAEGAGPGENILRFTRNERTVFAASLHRVFRSNRLGKTWTLLAPPFKGTITSMEAVPNSRSVILATTDGLFLSNDDGASWLLMKSPPRAKNVRLIRVTQDGSRWGFASDEGLFVSGDAGATWSKIQTPEEKGAVYDFALQGKDAIAIGTLRGLAYSRDGGRNWTLPLQGLNQGTVESVLWHPYRETVMYAVQNGLPYASRDGGMNWDALRTDEIKGDSIVDLHWAADHSKVYAVTFARGLFVQNLSLASSAVGSSDH